VSEDLRALAAYDQARPVRPAYTLPLLPLDDGPWSALADHVKRDRLSARLRAMREARERAGASCP